MTPAYIGFVESNIPNKYKKFARSTRKLNNVRLGRRLRTLQTEEAKMMGARSARIQELTDDRFDYGDTNVSGLGNIVNWWSMMIARGEYTLKDAISGLEKIKKELEGYDYGYSNEELDLMTRQMIAKTVFRSRVDNRVQTFRQFAATYKVPYESYFQYYERGNRGRENLYPKKEKKK